MSAAAADVLSPRGLNRGARPGADALERLVGLQGQAPDAPYVGLWTRLADFRPGDLVAAICERQAVRMSLMRATIHLVTARDALALRPVMQPVLDRSFAGSPFARNLDGVDPDELHTVGRALLDERPLTRAELAPVLGERWPDRDATSLCYAVTYRLPIVQVPPRGVWGSTGPAAWTTVAAWLGRDLDGEASPDQLVLRYLAAFGPATVKDVQSWSGLTRLREVADRLRPQLRAFRDESGAELLDLPDAPRPDPDEPAPPRFLPEYDNVLLSHADRTRINPERRRVPLPPGNGGAAGTLLVDGLFRGTWAINRLPDADAATLTVRPFVRLTPADADAVTVEAAELLAFAAPARSHDVRIEPPTG
jgi:hypothetical protein